MSKQNDYIRRSDALSALAHSYADSEYDECEEESVKRAMRVILRVPAADVREVKRGRMSCDRCVSCDNTDGNGNWQEDGICASCRSADWTEKELNK